MLHDLRVSADALQRVADWMLSTGAGGADVQLRRDGDVLVAEQGDDRAAWDMDGHMRPDGADAMPAPPEGMIARSAIIQALRDAWRNDSAADAVEYVSEMVGWDASRDAELIAEGRAER